MDNGAYKKYLEKQRQAEIKANAEKGKKAADEERKKLALENEHNNQQASARINRQGAAPSLPPPATSTNSAGKIGGRKITKEEWDAAKAAAGEQRTTDADESAAETARLARKEKELVVESNKYVEFEPRSNLLLEYADYTYSLSLHIIPPKKYNDMVLTPGYVYNTMWDPFFTSSSKKSGVRKITKEEWDRGVAITDASTGNTGTLQGLVGTVLISSAGRRGDQYNRHPAFKEDFYFENLTMKTIVGMNVRTKNTNAIEMSFTIVEPYGVTLLDRLLEVTKQIGTKSWMQIPYMLQVDFLGNNSAGELLTPIPNQTKYIPIRILACKINISTKGAEYQIQAMPFGQQAFTESIGSTPAILEVQASTVGEFFSSKGNAGQASSIIAVQQLDKERLDGIYKEVAAEKKKTNPDDKRVADLQSKAESVTKDLAKTPYIVGSYAAAMNSYQSQLATTGHSQHAEIYEFDIHPDIAKSKIVIPKTTTSASTTMTDPVKALRNNAKMSNVGIDQSKSGFSINAGTSIIEVINMVMRASDLVRDQIYDPATDAKKITKDKNDPMAWFKITSTVELLEFDSIRDTYSKKITYHIMPTAIFNTKFPNAPKSEPKSVTKQYHYMYSGRNDSIIDFSLDFDTMFYTAITADRSKIQQTEVQQENPDGTRQLLNNSTGSVQITNHQIKLVSGHADIPRAANPDSKAALVTDFYKSTLSSSRGDMINVKLKILGDPEFIKQDDIFFNPRTNPDQNSGKLIDKNGSIMFDSAERFVLLTFNTPVDVDPESGLMVVDSKYTTSAFSGIYKIITVDNEFTGGAFTQTLDLIRIFENFNGVEPEERQPELTTIPQNKTEETAVRTGVNLSNTSSGNSRGKVTPSSSLESAGYPEAYSDPMGSGDGAAIMHEARQSTPPLPPPTPVSTGLPDPVKDPKGYKAEINRRLKNKYGSN